MSLFLLLKDNVTGYRIVRLGCVFSSNTLNSWFRSLLTCVASETQPSVDLSFSLHGRFSSGSLRFSPCLLVFAAWLWYAQACIWGDLSTWFSLSFLDPWFGACVNFGKFLPWSLHIFLLLFSSLLVLPPIFPVCSRSHRACFSGPSFPFSFLFVMQFWEFLWPFLWAHWFCSSIIWSAYEPAVFTSVQCFRFLAFLLDSFLKSFHFSASTTHLLPHFQLALLAY